VGVEKEAYSLKELAHKLNSINFTQLTESQLKSITKEKFLAFMAHILKVSYEYMKTNYLKILPIVLKISNFNGKITENNLKSVGLPHVQRTTLHIIGHLTDMAVEAEKVTPDLKYFPLEDFIDYQRSKDDGEFSRIEPILQLFTINQYKKYLVSYEDQEDSNILQKLLDFNSDSSVKEFLSKYSEVYIQEQINAHEKENNEHDQIDNEIAEYENQIIKYENFLSQVEQFTQQGENINEIFSPQALESTIKENENLLAQKEKLVSQLNEHLKNEKLYNELVIFSIYYPL
ncbi:MAG: hypothetical protein MHPSP_002093, partial [Paramarteilia canceri]